MVPICDIFRREKVEPAPMEQANGRDFAADVKSKAVSSRRTEETEGRGLPDYRALASVEVKEVEGRMVHEGLCDR